jgi:hypothetical protein
LTSFARSSDNQCGRYSTTRSTTHVRIGCATVWLSHVEVKVAKVVEAAVNVYAMMHSAIGEAWQTYRVRNTRVLSSCLQQVRQPMSVSNAACCTRPRTYKFRQGCSSHCPSYAILEPCRLCFCFYNIAKKKFKERRAESQTETTAKECRT